MKRGNILTTLSGCLALLLAFGLSSCSKENNSSAESKTISVKAYNGNEFASSRPDYTDSGSGSIAVVWSANDAFSMYRGTGTQAPATFALTEGAGTHEGTFEGTLPAGTSTALLAFYPKSTSDTSPTAISRNVSSQTGGTIASLANYDYMTATATYSENSIPALSFAHRMAVIRFDVTLPGSGITGLSIALSATSGLYTTGVFNLSTAALTNSDNGTITATGGSTSGKIYTVYAVVYPSTITGLKMTIATSDNKTYTKTFSTASITITAGKRYTVAYSIPSGTISDIEDGGELK